MRPSFSKITRRKYNDCLLQLDALRAGRPNVILRGGRHADERVGPKAYTQTSKHLAYMDGHGYRVLVKLGEYVETTRRLET